MLNASIVSSAGSPSRVALPLSFGFFKEKTPALLTGSSAVFSLAMLWQTHLARKGFLIHNIDCAIRFNTYAIAEEAFRLGFAPELIADSITVTRAFTPYQILDATQRIFHEPKRLTFILAPCKQFFDGDVAFDEGLYLLEKLVLLFQKMKALKIPLAIIEKNAYSHPVFSSAYAKIKRLSSAVFTLNGLPENQYAPTYKRGF
ncbi:MAG: hypothetical protein OEZ13_05160 [Spirochaetia bacterium]|nr:hypothetical protein [Spirochaetia bacterium]